MSTQNKQYDDAAILTDCRRPSSGYNHPYFQLKPQPDVALPSCDNRSYSAYALNPRYQGYYDHCSMDCPNKACDLAYLSSTPKKNIECWSKCCDGKDAPCTQKCQVDCVVGK